MHWAVQAPCRAAGKHSFTWSGQDARWTAIAEEQEQHVQDRPEPAAPPLMGAFVRLVRNESGPYAAGRAGDWGMVERVDRHGALTVMVGGYSRGRTDALTRLSGISPSIVEPCDRQGRPLPRRATAWRPLEAPRPAPAPRRGPWRAAAAVTLAIGCVAFAAAVLMMRNKGWIEAMF
jgi:hypothetical protein